MLNSKDLPDVITQDVIKRVAEMLGVEAYNFNNLVKITITSGHVEYLWEDLCEIDQLHRAVIAK